MKLLKIRNAQLVRVRVELRKLVFLQRRIVLRENNARPNITCRAPGKIDKLNWKYLIHPQYGPDGVPTASAQNVLLNFSMFSSAADGIRAIVCIANEISAVYLFVQLNEANYNLY